MISCHLLLKYSDILDDYFILAILLYIMRYPLLILGVILAAQSEIKKEYPPLYPIIVLGLNLLTLVGFLFLIK